MMTNDSVRTRTSYMADLLTMLRDKGGMYQNDIPEYYRSLADEAAERGYCWRFSELHDETGVVSVFYTLDDETAQGRMKQLDEAPYGWGSVWFDSRLIHVVANVFEADGWGPDDIASDWQDVVDFAVERELLMVAEDEQGKPFAYHATREGMTWAFNRGKELRERGIDWASRCRQPQGGE